MKFHQSCNDFFRLKSPPLPLTLCANPASHQHRCDPLSFTDRWLRLPLWETHYGENHAVLQHTFKHGTKVLILTASESGLLKISIFSLLIEKTNVLGSEGWNRWHYRKWHCSSCAFSFSARRWQPWCFRLFSPGGKVCFVLFLRTVKNTEKVYFRFPR